MKRKFMSFFLALVMLVGTVTPVLALESSKTMSQDEKIQWLQEEKILEGRKIFKDGEEKTDLALEENITRAEISKLLVHLLNVQDLAKSLTGKDTSFSDVKSDHWASGYIAALTNLDKDVAYGRKIMRGYEDGSFRPENKVTYAELAVMLVRVSKADLEAYDEELANVAENWPKQWVDWAKASGLFQGVEVEDYNQPATRDLALVMIYNGINISLDQSKDENITDKKTSRPYNDSFLSYKRAEELRKWKERDEGRTPIQSDTNYLDKEPNSTDLDGALEKLENLLEAVSKAEAAIKDLPSEEDISIEDKEAVKKAKELVEAVIELDVNIKIEGQEKIIKLEKRIKELEKARDLLIAQERRKEIISAIDFTEEELAGMTDLSIYIAKDKLEEMKYAAMEAIEQARSIEEVESIEVDKEAAKKFLESKLDLAIAKKNRKKVIIDINFTDEELNGKTEESIEKAKEKLEELKKDALIAIENARLIEEVESIGVDKEVVKKFLVDKPVEVEKSYVLEKDFIRLDLHSLQDPDNIIENLKNMIKLEEKIDGKVTRTLKNDEYIIASNIGDRTEISKLSLEPGRKKLFILVESEYLEFTLRIPEVKRFNLSVKEGSVFKEGFFGYMEKNLIVNIDSGGGYTHNKGNPYGRNIKIYQKGNKEAWELSQEIKAGSYEIYASLTDNRKNIIYISNPLTITVEK